MSDAQHFTFAFFAVAWLICVWVEYRLSRHADERIEQAKSAESVTRKLMAEAQRRYEVLMKLERALNRNDLDEFNRLVAEHNTHCAIWKAQHMVYAQDKAKQDQ